MFMCSGQLFSQGESARFSHTPARQRLARMWSSNSCRKWRMVVSTGLGAVCPRPHSDMSRIMRPNSSRLSRSASVPWPSVKALRIFSALSCPTRQGTHLPQDSEWVNSTKNRATSTMQLSSSITTMPPEPMMEPSLASVS